MIGKFIGRDMSRIGKHIQDITCASYLQAHTKSIWNNRPVRSHDDLIIKTN